MIHSLLWGTLGLGCVGWLSGALLARPRAAPAAESSSSRAFWLSAALLPLLIFALTLPARPPFAPGQGWGRGFVLGALGALLAAWVVQRARQSASALAPVSSVTAPQFLALVTVAIPLLWMRLLIVDALLGVASGWLATSLILFYAILHEERPEDDTPVAFVPDDDGEEHTSSGLSLLGGMGFALTLCAVAVLGVYRDGLDSAVPRGTWSAMAVLLAAGVPFSLMLAALAAQISARGGAHSAASWVRNGLPLIVLLVLGQLLATRLIDQPSLLFVIAIGLITGLLMGWLGRDAAKSPDARAYAPGAAATFVMLGAFMAAYQMLQGYGAGAMLLAAWPAFALATLAVPNQSVAPSQTMFREHGALGVPLTAPLTAPLVLSSPVAPTVLGPTVLGPTVLGALLFGLVLLLYRVFAMRFRGELHGVSLTDHYALFGFLLGATLPAFLADLQAPAPSARALTRLIFAGVLALAAPVLVLGLWGSKCALAMLAGLALAATGFKAAPRQRFVSTTLHALPAALFALAIALILTQWTRHILPLAELPRLDRLRALTYVAGGVIFVLLATDYGARLAAWLHRRRTISPRSK